jgi:large subunit ribosomal protein LP0
MVKVDRRTWKNNFFNRLEKLVQEFPKVLVVTVDNVGSKQMQQIRIALRGSGEILMGKNTLIRKCLRSFLEKNPQLENLLPWIRGNVGFVFTNQDLRKVKDLVLANKVKAPAKAGAIAPVDVWVPAGNTSHGPEKTSFYQALAIPTKISRGTIEILNDVHLIKKGEKVGASEATLLNMLNVSPFSYGLVLTQIYEDGATYDPAVLDISLDDIRARFLSGVRNIASLSLQIGYPTLASVPHSLVNGLKKLIAVAAVTDITFPAAEKTKAYLANPTAFAAAAPAAAPKAAAAKEEKKEAPKKEEKKEESDQEGGFGGLFD